jgi:pimeloyl-ACP methyl ester carboxylesterase
VVAYDEFSMFADNAAEAGLEWTGPPTVRRELVEVDDGLRVSALVWGEADPELVLVHGGAQNAHTWDTVALALGRPLVAVDLPGHGHSDWRPAHDYSPPVLAEQVAQVVHRLAPGAAAIVGMSLGGLTSICLASRHSELVRKLGIVDVTPGTDHAKAEPIVTFVSGPQYFDSFDDILARTIEHNPGRSESSLRRGVLHNAMELPDGRWTWRYDPMRDWKVADGDSGDSEDEPPPPPTVEFGDLWDDVEAIRVPVALWQGGAWSVVDDADVAEFVRRHPDTEHHVVDGAGHSIQGDRPVELARLIEDFVW